MDGINGIAAVSAAVAFVLFAVYTSGSDDYIVIWHWAIVAACIGFLPANFPKARVFLGDVGSILLGMLFACSVAEAGLTLRDFVCFASFLFPFYADELTTMFIRLRDGQNLMTPHRRHMYQLLVNEMKVSHWKVTIGYGMAQALVGLTCIYLSANSLFMFMCLTLYFGFFIAIQAHIRNLASKMKPSSHQTLPLGLERLEEG
jgi:Fuc2NAc and GlcNAc transferase